MYIFSTSMGAKIDRESGPPAARWACGARGREARSNYGQKEGHFSPRGNQN